MANDLAAISANDEHLIGDYKLLKIIGKGSYGVVWLARHMLSGTEVAVKAISRDSFLKCPQEFHLLKRLNHPNIVQLFEVISTPDNEILVMEHVNRGNLWDYLNAHYCMSEEEARPMFRQLVSAVQYCHQRGIMHGDLKPANLLIDRELNIKVADFGLSREVTDENLSTFCGTLAFMPPEVLLRKTKDGPKVDVWSLGVVLYYMVVGILPFMGDNFLKLKKAILKGQFFIPYKISTEGHRLLRKLLTFNPHDRPSLEDIMSEPWLRKGQEEELRPYTEPPVDDIDPQVMEIMNNMSFNWDAITESLTQKKFDRLMGTYLILKMARTKMEGDTLRVRPDSFPDLNSSASLSQEVQPSKLESEEPALPPSSLSSSWMINLYPANLESKLESEEPALPPSSLSSSWMINLYPASLESKLESEEFALFPSCLWSMITLYPDSLQSKTITPPSSLVVRTSTRSASLQSRTSTPQPCLEMRTFTPPLSLELGTSTPSPALQHGLGGSPTADSGCSTSLGRGDQEGPTNENCLEAKQPDGGTPASPGPRQGRQGLARRVLRFLLRFACCGPSTHKMHIKRTKIQPM